MQFADLLWPILLLLGLEHVRIVPKIMRWSHLDLYDYPISHSLLALVGWGLGFGLLWLIFRGGESVAAVLAAGVVSHWLLDLPMHRPDLPVLPNGPFLGLGLWNSLPATLALEGGIAAVGLAFYLRSTTAKDRIGIYALWSLLVLLGVIWLASLFGPPPPSEEALGFSALGVWLFVPWGYWIDRHRKPTGNGRRAAGSS